MNKIQYSYILLIYFSIIDINCFSLNNFEKIIISLTSNHENIYKTEKVINSIIEQNIDQKLYEILLILSKKDYQNIIQLPKTIQYLEQTQKIRILIVNEYLTEQKRTLITMKNYANNPILIINNLFKLPNGWLEMFIKDHIKYPNDAIVASLQYFFDKNFEISEFKEGFNGNKFGFFNHVSEIIFNFALIEIDLGGILYPKHYFKNMLFYDYNLFLNSTNNSEDFWESAFIIIEDKILRQSSKIFDYTKYLINEFNYLEYYFNKKKILEQSKFSFLKQFPNFNELIKKRQKKIIVSLASYPERFAYLPDLMNFINKQNLPINKIIFSFYKEHRKYYNLNIKNVDIIFTEKNLKPHLKYYYSMQLYRDYAIITLDDDLGYSYDTFESLFNAYLENPNIISGRRAHLMKFYNNGEVKKYNNWIFEYKLINTSDFNLTLTNGAGSIFPPDILNINEDFLPIINETITCDDLTLKYFSIRKGIPHKWIINKNIMGIPRRLPKTKSFPLSKINFKFNNICINKLNLNIKNIFLNNLCFPFKNLSTGASIYLYDINNKNLTDNILSFDIDAYSYCPIEDNLNFAINFNNYTANCIINQKYKLLLGKNKRTALCKVYNYNQDVEDLLYLKAYSNDNIKIHIFNYRKYLTTIFKNFYCEEFNNCYLEVLAYENISFNKYQLNIDNQIYLCCLLDKNYFTSDIFPVKIIFQCRLLNSSSNIFLVNKNIISGLPQKIELKNKTKENDIILYKFIIVRIAFYNDNQNLIFIGRLEDNLDNDLYNIALNILHPNITLYCSLRAYSKFVQSMIFCKVNNINITSQEFIIENQIVRLVQNKSDLLLINEETLIKLNFNKINNMEDIIKQMKKRKKLNILEKNNFKRIINLQIYILLIIIILKLKLNH